MYLIEFALLAIFSVLIKVSQEQSFPPISSDGELSLNWGNLKINDTVLESLMNQFS